MADSMLDQATPPPASLQERAAQLSWYHCIELAPGVVTAGMFDLRPHVDRYGLPEDLTGVRALDVGTFDGFWAFELERRGAEVVALDVANSAEYDWPPRLRPAQFESRGETFELAREVLGSRVTRRAVNVYDATPDALGGAFDLVFVGSMLIHLRDPMLALQRLAAVCRDRLVLCEEYSPRVERIPFLKLAEFRGETPWMTWWRPTTKAWMAMIRTAGFEDVVHRGRFSMRVTGRSARVPHTVIHAQGAPS